MTHTASSFPSPTSLLPDPSVVINPISHGILFFESSLSPGPPPRSPPRGLRWGAQDLRELRGVLDQELPRR